MLNKIDEQALVTDIVNRDYRTALVFRKYNIDFCCGGRVPLSTACNIRNLDIDEVRKDLENATYNRTISSTLKFDEWQLGFLADYIVHIHHAYLKNVLPETLEQLSLFAKGHRKKYDYLPELEQVFVSLSRELVPHLTQEEDILFPYIRQIANAYYKKESYARLLVRTLSKPVEEVMRHEQAMITHALQRMRELTNYYTPPANACTSHKVSFFLLREIDNDLVQHLYLENDILFPKAIQMEKELLQQG